MRLPDFLVIGAMKAGTTAFHSYLDRHPDIFMSEEKGPGFFSREDVFARGLDWYGRLFADATPAQICGESSTCYTRSLAYPNAPERIARALPHPRSKATIFVSANQPAPRLRSTRVASSKRSQT